MNSKGYSRHERVAAQIRRDLATLIQQEVKDPEVGFVSVSDVEVSRDLGHAKVFVTVFDSDEAKISVGALNRSAGFLRTRLGQGLRMRSVPELHFHHDTSVEQGAHMDAILRGLNTTPAASEDETS